MKSPDGSNDSSAEFLEWVGTFFRCAASFLGMVLIVFGLMCGIRLFNAVYACLRQPEGFAPLMQKWTQILSAAGAPQALPADMLALLVLVGGASFLGVLSLSFMVTGTKIITWTSGDREVVKAVVREFFGTNKAPAKLPSSDA